MKKNFILLTGIFIAPYLFAEDGSCRSKTTEAELTQAIESVEESKASES